MSTTDGLSLYIAGGNPIPIKADGLKFGVFVDPKKTSTVIIDGHLRVRATSDNEKSRQKLEFMVPTLFDGVDVRRLIQDAVASSGQSGVLITLKSTVTSESYRYRDCYVTEGGEVDDKDGRYIKYTFEGIEI